MSQTHTATIRMGAAFNDLTMGGRVRHLPPPPEPHRGRKPESERSRDAKAKKLAILAAIGRDVCAAAGIVGKQRRPKPANSNRRPRREAVAA